MDIVEKTLGKQNIIERNYFRDTEYAEARCNDGAVKIFYFIDGYKGAFFMLDDPLKAAKEEGKVIGHYQRIKKNGNYIDPKKNNNK
ncbi:hypothetical protein AUK11_01465 [bacterium CG2_30_37_16]|nr:MAG: hypothetical protein AUK11_01465 [bacterium CG2_30_37_16]PIP31277.1 MAG: hypothetical protein COX25_00275 [bacterium (Candidatus Howlettbacteria) CG23_combo_of_CG06-09_8_20_14_all_37_9]PIX98869.1 MAG: hypothetical protein COZ22_04005 [bacterium (Candidatus Howlettbacteria) CG_4_10_14_3_um_filter_37_10]PJB05705.1 MAG: hypothetical protein CO123_03670 [bacterium (Candidatus Howlettbacteria) CG_4_9_14_3_um_filter_37_10]